MTMVLDLYSLCHGLLLLVYLFSISEDNDDEIEKDLTPAQKFLLGDTVKALPLAAREKVAVAEKVTFSEKFKQSVSKT